MTDTHKAALAEGRTEGRAVRLYLQALQDNKPKRGRKRTAESITKRLAAIDASFSSAAAIDRLHMTQERIDLQLELSEIGESVSLDALEEAFVAAARSYSERKGISYQAWRSLGVSVDVLKKAGVKRTAH
jgi:hypothetical protein